MSKFFSLGLLVLALLCSWFYLSRLPLTAASNGTVINVNTSIDELNNDGDCSLREAVVAANTDTATDACPAGNGTDSIFVPSGIYTLTLIGTFEDHAATGDLDLTQDTTVAGQSQSETIIDGNASDRVFDILYPSHVTLTNLTIQHGSVFNLGGGIQNTGTLTLTQIDLRYNAVTYGSGGGIGNTHELYIYASKVSHNETQTGAAFGGGIYNSGKAKLDTVLLSENRAAPDSIYGAGGGLANRGGALTLVNVSVISNTSYAGGGIHNFIIQGTYMMVIANSTVGGNQAQTGGGILSSGKASLQNVTIAGNTAADTGGMFTKSAEVSLTITNTLFSDNANGNCGGKSFGTRGYNLSSDSTCETFFSDKTDQNRVSPQLEALAQVNSYSLVYPFSAGSPAIDAGTNKGCPKTDQSGVERPQDGDGTASNLCDIGAYELPASGTTTTPTLQQPKNKSIVATRRPVLNWTDTAWVAHFDIEIYNNSPIGALIATRKSAASKLKAPELDPGTYVWHVRACNALGCSTWTPFWRFTVAP